MNCWIYSDAKLAVFVSDFLDIPLFKIRYPRDYVRYTDAIWTNIDTNLYLDFTITNLYDFDFFAIETSVVVKVLTIPFLLSLFMRIFIYSLFFTFYSDFKAYFWMSMTYD